MYSVIFSATKWIRVLAPEPIPVYCLGSQVAVINLAICCHYFLSGLWLRSKSQSITGVGSWRKVTTDKRWEASSSTRPDRDKVILLCYMTVIGHKFCVCTRDHEIDTLTLHHIETYSATNLQKKWHNLHVMLNCIHSDTTRIVQSNYMLLSWILSDIIFI